MQQKTIEIDGVQYTVSRRTNLNEVNTRFYKRMIALTFEQLASELGVELEQLATTLLDFAHVSGQVIGGTILLTRNDDAETIVAKCRRWATDGDIMNLSSQLIEAVNTINTVQPDTALAPDPLPDDADPKASSAAKPNRKRRSRTG